MSENILVSFESVLDRHGYENHYEKYNISPEGTHTYNLYGKKRWIVEVKNDDGLVIQVFVLMRDSSRMHHKKYPIWESYHQAIGKSSVEVNPAVFIASRTDSGEWSVYSASAPKEKCDWDYIVNYDWARERFDMRVRQAHRLDKMIKTVRRVSWFIAAVFSIYLVLHIVFSIQESFLLPLTNEIVILGAVIALLIIFPIMLPHIKGLSLNGLEINW